MYALIAPAPRCSEIFLGPSPTRIVATTSCLAMSTTETVLSPSLVTYARAPFDVSPTQWGNLPTATSLTT